MTLRRIWSALVSVVLAPRRHRQRRPDVAPQGQEHYVPTALAVDSASVQTAAAAFLAMLAR